jgi:hypothetical protein
LAEFFQEQFDADMNNTDSLSAVVEGIHNGAPRLDMPPSPPPSPPASACWQLRRTYSFS